jgi:hypothetical protein
MSNKRNSSNLVPEHCRNRKTAPKRSGNPSRGRPFGKNNRYAWQPGQSGNPAGRPKYRTLSESYRHQLAQIDPDDPLGRTYAECIAENLCKIAVGLTRGNSTDAARELADRTEGKSRQAIQIEPVEDARRTLAALLGRSVDDLPLPRTG